MTMDFQEAGKVVINYVQRKAQEAGKEPGAMWAELMRSDAKLQAMLRNYDLIRRKVDYDRQNRR